MKGKKLFLLDIMPLLYRAHFATMGKRFGTTTGIDTRTTLVFFNYIFQLLTEEKPDAIAAALDSKAVSRVAVSETYKANREKMPGEISEAFPYAMRLLEALRIPVLKEAGFEADDIIATLAKKAEHKQYDVFIVSPDKDFAQLVTKQVFLFRPAYKGAVMETLNVAGVKKKYGVEPYQIPDYLALRGDSVDNIIGIKGIGDKTAAQLLSNFGTVEELIQGVEQIQQPKIKEAIESTKAQLLLNKSLAVLTGAMEFEINWDEIKVSPADESKLLPLLNELQLEKLKERIVKLGLIDNTEGMASEKDAVEEFSFVQTTPVEAIQKMIEYDKVALGYQEEISDKIYCVLGEGNLACEVVLKDDTEWIVFIKGLQKGQLNKFGWQLKPLLKRINQLGYQAEIGWVDLSIAAYLLEPDAKIDWQYIQGKYEPKKFKVPAQNKDLSYLPSLPEVYKKVMPRIDEVGLKDLLFNIELPLQNALARMELHGIGIDVHALDEIDEVLTLQLKELEARIYESAGTKFNIGSPAQTAEILKRITEPSELKKTKTGQISTAEPFLADIAPKYPFVADLLNYRKLHKIITTYVYSLPKYINPSTKKIHPTFQQVVAGTGRLSCTDPNLQNLPIINEAGREVRKAIVASEPGCSIVSIDYNQIELRLLAVLSGDKVMIEAFKNGKDIHTTTATRVFKVDEDKVTKDMRSKAKGINFGIAYGITPWGLASRLKISQKEAKEIIDAYFEEFSYVKAYLDQSLTETRERGFTKTKYGRIRFIEGIDSRNGTTRKIAERMGVNAPLQGLAADIIKEAMVNIDRFIIRSELKTKMILQVHDELVFDAADGELDLLVPEVTRLMETKAGLDIPLKVNVTVGKNWLQQVSFQLR